MAQALLTKIRILPLLIAAGALAFGVHAGEAVRTATSAKPVNRTPAKLPLTVQPSRTEIELAEEIAAKRAGNDDRKRQIELRERLLEASEKRIDAKLADLKASEARTGNATTVRQTAMNEQFASLVRVYETMKPKDAARIFEKLDMSVQLAVATRMKERNMAAIMSEMTPEAARNLTMEMAANAQLTNLAIRQGNELRNASQP